MLSAFSRMAKAKKALPFRMPKTIVYILPRLSRKVMTIYP